MIKQKENNFELIKQMQEKTGCAIMAAKTCLSLNDYDLDKAILYYHTKYFKNKLVNIKL